MELGEEVRALRVQEQGEQGFGAGNVFRRLTMWFKRDKELRG